MPLIYRLGGRGYLSEDTPCRGDVLNLEDMGGITNIKNMHCISNGMHIFVM
jgi:hypothetical protein